MCSIENPFKSSRNDPPCDDAEQLERDGVVAESDSTPINPFSFSSLYDSMTRCKKGVMWKQSVISFFMNGITRCLKMENDFINNSYKASDPKFFKIYRPKEREIISTTFKDRIPQRSVNDLVLYPVMTKSFIYDNCACQKGKGTDFARNRLKCFMQRYYRRYGTEGWVLQCDIKGYYKNISHDLVNDMFANKLNGQVLDFVLYTLSNQYKGSCGYNAGSQMVQILGISFLDKLDHFIKENLRIKYYVRYMDDFILIHNDKAVLENAFTKIKNELSKIGLSLNPKKSRIYKLEDGIDFLGFIFRLNQSGSIWIRVRSSNVKEAKRRLRKLVTSAKKGMRTKESVDLGFTCWKSHASKGNSHHLIKRMELFYEGLWDD